jgi:hypothetical protein
MPEYRHWCHYAFGGVIPFTIISGWDTSLTIFIMAVSITGFHFYEVYQDWCRKAFNSWKDICEFWIGFGSGLVAVLILTLGSVL